MRAFMSVIVTAFLAGGVAAQDAGPAAALQKLKDGNARFAADKPSKRDISADRRKELAKGQKPFAIVLTCADSRVAPELLFDTGLGDLFVVRVAGNIADPAIVGSIEFAVEQLQAPLIVVLGHESCGAVAAAIDGKPLAGDLGWLVKQVKPGDKLPSEKDAKLAAAVRNNVLAAAMDLDLRSKAIHEAVDQKKVLIAPAVYSLKTGQIEWLTAEKKQPREKVAPPKANPESLPGIEGGYHQGVVQQPARFPRLRALFKR
jgi:carbonic anhydrase